MAQNITYGVGGWCSECSPEHDHPLENIIEITEIPDEPISE